MGHAQSRLKIEKLRVLDLCSGLMRQLSLVLTDSYEISIVSGQPNLQTGEKDSRLIATKTDPRAIAAADLRPSALGCQPRVKLAYD